MNRFDNSDLWLLLPPIGLLLFIAAAFKLEGWIQ